MESAFEDHGVGRLGMATQPGLALYASGRDTGVVVDMGHAGGLLLRRVSLLRVQRPCGACPRSPGRR